MASASASTTVPSPPFAIDVCDPRFYDDPWDAYRWLRNHAPLWWDAANELWVISKHEDVSYVSRNPEIFNAAQGVRPAVAAPMSIISMDDPEHTRQRRLINRGFTPKVVRDLTDHIRELSDQIIAEVRDRGEIDFVEDFAIHVPLIVIAELMGLDPEIRHRLYRWSDAMMAGDGHLDADDPVLLEAANAAGEYAVMCTELIAERRASGRTDDLIGVLTNAFDQGALERQIDGIRSDLDAVAPLADDDLIMFLILLVVAGNETTRNALSGGLRALSQSPEQRQKLVEDPSLLETGVDEIIRFVSPVLTFSRTLTTDHHYKGVDFRAGQRVLMLYQSANRDEDVFDEPDELRLDRDPNPHLAFGIGTHYCLGSNLAKAEVRVVFEQLFGHLHDIRAADPEAPLDRGDSTLVSSIRHLPAVFTPQP